MLGHVLTCVSLQARVSIIVGNVQESSFIEPSACACCARLMTPCEVCEAERAADMRQRTVTCMSSEHDDKPYRQQSSIMEAPSPYQSNCIVTSYASLTYIQANVSIV